MFLPVHENEKRKMTKDPTVFEILGKWKVFQEMTGALLLVAMFFFKV